MWAKTPMSDERRTQDAKEPRLGLLRFFFGQAFDQVENAFAHLDVLDLHEGQRELQPFAAGNEIHHRRTVDFIGAGRGIVHAFIKEIHRHIENARDFKQTSGADAVDALFVFLDLLKRQTQQAAETFLTHADQHAPNAHAIADLNVNGVGLFLG